MDPQWRNVDCCMCDSKCIHSTLHYCISNGKIISRHVSGYISDCQWTSIPNAYRRAGGALQPGILNVSACQSACFARYPNCQEFDFIFNSSSIGCYLTTDNSPLIYEVARMRAHYSISCAIAPGGVLYSTFTRERMKE